MFGAFRIGPQALKVVKFAVFVVKYMYYDIYIVHQCPLVALFHMIRALITFFLHTFFYVIGYGLNLYVRPCLAQYEKISYSLVNFLQVQRHDLVAFFLLYGAYYCFKKFAVLCLAGC